MAVIKNVKVLTLLCLPAFRGGLNRPMAILRAACAVLLLFFAAELGAEEPRPGAVEFMPVDLTRLTWRGVVGFERGYAGGLPVDLEHVKTINRFPVILNSAFGLPPGKGLREFTLETKFRLTGADLSRGPALHLPWMGEGWEIYLNGQLVRDELHLAGEGDSRRLTRMRIVRHLTVLIPARALREGENTLVVHFAGYAQPTALEANTNLGFIFSTDYTVGSYDDLLRKHDQTLRIVLITVYLFFGFYHILMYLFERRVVYNFFFGMLCLALAGDSITGIARVHELVADTSWLNRIKYCCQASIIPFFGSFVSRYFLGVRTMVLHYCNIFLGIIAAAFWIAPFQYTESLLIIFQVSVLPIIAYVLFFMLRIMRRRAPDSFLIGGSVLTLVAAAVWGIVDDLLFQTAFHPLPYAFLASIFALVVILANRFLRVHRESERLNIELEKQKNAFHRFVPTQFLEHLGRRSAVDIQPGDSAALRMSVLFSDIRSFTGLAERSGHREAFRYVNEFLSEAAARIEEHGGFVDKFVGDAVLALFAARESDGDRGAPAAAIRAALGIRRIVLSSSIAGVTASVDNSFGVGINTGELILGTVGNQRRLDTTVIGDTVNTAARIEGLTARYGAGVLITESTRSALGETADEKFLIRFVDKVIPAGRRLPVALYEVFDADPEPLREVKQRTRERMAEAMSLYRSRAFNDAEAAFQELIADGLDPLPAVYRERCARLRVAPPPENWDGSTNLPK